MDTPTPRPVTLYVDADACPVKEEVFRVARRFALPVLVVANGGMRVPREPLFTLVRVDDGFDAADNWIAARATQGDIVITADIPLAHRCLAAGAAVLGPSGKPFTRDSIGAALAVRSIMEDLRAGGTNTGGPPPFSDRDRSRFLNALDAMIRQVQRAK